MSFRRSRSGDSAVSRIRVRYTDGTAVRRPLPAVEAPLLASEAGARLPATIPLPRCGATASCATCTATRSGPRPMASASPCEVGAGARVGGACAVPAGSRRPCSRPLHDIGLRGSYAHTASLASIGLCITLWIRAKTVDQDERERRAPRAVRGPVAADVLAHRGLAAGARGRPHATGLAAPRSGTAGS